MKSPFGKVLIFILVVLAIGIAYWKLKPAASLESSESSPPPATEIARTLPPVEQLPDAKNTNSTPVTPSTIFANQSSPVMGLVDENWRGKLKQLIGPPVMDGLESRLGFLRLGHVARQQGVEAVLGEYRAQKLDLENLARTFAGWSLYDATAAEAWLTATNDPALQAALRPTISIGLSSADTTAAIQDFAGLTSEQKMSRGAEASRVLVETAGVESIEQLLASEEDLQKKGRNENFILQTIFGVAAEQRQKAVEAGGSFDEFKNWMSGHALKPFATKELYSAVAAQVTEHSGNGGGVSWLATLATKESAQPVKDALLEEFGKWAKQDPESAKEWVGTQAAHPAHALLIQAMK